MPNPLTDANVKTPVQQNSLQGGLYQYRIMVTFSDRRSVVAVVYSETPKPTTGWIRPRGKK